MADLFAPQQNTRTPRREAERLKTLAESLQKGGQSKGNEMVSGIVVKQSPLEHLARGLQTAAGGYFAGQAQNKEEEDERLLQGRIAEALSQWGTDPQAAAMALASDPRTSQMAMQLMQGELDYGRQQDRWAQQDALARELAQSRADRPSGQTESLLNRIMQERPDIDFMEALTIAQKGTGQGAYVRPDGTIGILGEPANFGNMPNQYPIHQEGYGNIPPVNMMPNGEMQAPTMGGQIPNGPLNPMQFQELGQQQQFDNLIGGLTGQQQDPVAAHAAAVQAQQQQIGVSPMQRPDLRQPTGRTYADVQAQMAAQKKAAEENAAMLAGPMPAQIVLAQNDLVEKINTSQGLESRMGKFINQIDTGQLDLGLMANLENMARNNMSMSTEQSRNLQSFKATLENLRNESLRLNTGVQTDGDAQRAWNELVANINDPQVVRQRLTEIAEINNRGAQLQQQRLNLMRSEYGRGGMEIPNIYQQNTQPAATQDINAEIESLERELGLR